MKSLCKHVCTRVARQVTPYVIQVTISERYTAISIPRAKVPQLLTLVTYAATTEVVRHWRWTAAQLVDGGALRELRNTLCKSHQRLWRRAAPVPLVLLTPWHVNYFVNFPPARGCGPSIVPARLSRHFQEYSQKPPCSLGEAMLVNEASHFLRLFFVLTALPRLPIVTFKFLLSLKSRNGKVFFFTKKFYPAG